VVGQGLGTQLILSVSGLTARLLGIRLTGLARQSLAAASMRTPLPGPGQWGSALALPSRLSDPGTAVCDVLFDAQQPLPVDAPPELIRVLFPPLEGATAGVAWRGRGFVIRADITATREDVMRATLTIQWSGPVVRQPLAPYWQEPWEETGGVGGLGMYWQEPWEFTASPMTGASPLYSEPWDWSPPVGSLPLRYTETWDGGNPGDLLPAPTTCYPVNNVLYAPRLAPPGDVPPPSLSQTTWLLNPGSGCIVWPQDTATRALTRGQMQATFDTLSVGPWRLGLCCLCSQQNMLGGAGGLGYGVALDNTGTASVVRFTDGVTSSVVLGSTSVQIPVLPSGHVNPAAGNYAQLVLTWDASPATLAQLGGPLFHVELGVLDIAPLAPVPALDVVVDRGASVPVTVGQALWGENCAWYATGVSLYGLS